MQPLKITKQEKRAALARKKKIKLTKGASLSQHIKLTQNSNFFNSSPRKKSL